MKIKCPYCESSFDDYMTHCPSCGAPNEGVVRTASDTPSTIEQLKEWYKSKGLPPSETTRFFIGVDYKQPRAFGIYKDEKTGNVVVYKNKDNGERAIRYEGTDEAYGVNELYLRLKQEIIEQKMNNAKKGSYSASARKTVKTSKEDFRKIIKGLLICLIGGPAALFAILVFIGAIIALFTPNDGYYSYENQYYYYDDRGYNDNYVFAYDATQKKWDEPVGKKDDPGIFAKKRKCKKYYLSENWDSSYNCSDIKTDEVYKDYDALKNITQGYYSTSDGYYYHYGNNYDSDWYYYDDYYDDWTWVSMDALPVELSRPSEVGDFFYTSTWDESTQFSDFTDSYEYEYNYASNNDSSDSDYSWDSSDSWDSGGSDFSSDW